MATFVKTTGAGGQQHGGALAFPLQLSQVKTVNKLGGNAQKQQQTVAQQIQHLSPFQQQILLQRQKQQQQQQQQQMLQANTASKIAQLGQVIHNYNHNIINLSYLANQLLVKF